MKKEKILLAMSSSIATLNFFTGKAFALGLDDQAVKDQLNVGKPQGFAFENVGELIKNAIGGLLIVAAILAFIYLILGGISWITSGGDKQAVEAARNKITNAIIGLIIVAAAYAIMLLAQGFLGLTLNSGINLFGGSGN